MRFFKFFTHGELSESELDRVRCVCEGGVGGRGGGIRVNEKEVLRRKSTATCVPSAQAMVKLVALPSKGMNCNLPAVF